MPTSPLPQAGRCLLGLLQAKSAQEAQDVLEAWPHDTQPSLLELSRRHGLSPALYHHLRHWASDLPDLPWHAWSADYLKTAGENTARYHELGRVLDAFRQASTDFALPQGAALLKGAVLAATVYDNIALRPMGDVDLLVPRAAFPVVRQTLEAMGYVADLSKEAHDQLGLEYENSMAFTHPDLGLTLEIHWCLLDSPYYQEHISEASLWSEVVPITLEGREAAALSPEANLVYLSAHWMLHHKGHHLRWLYDLDQFVRHQGQALDWAKVGRIAKRWALVMPLQAALRTMSELDTPIPPAQARALLEIAPSQGERRAFRYLTAPNRNVISRFAHDLWLIRGAGRKARYLWANLFPSRAYMRQRYDIPAGRPVWPYYPLRLATGIRQVLENALDAVGQLARGKPAS